jgi:hypothetical protein
VLTSVFSARTWPAVRTRINRAACTALLLTMGAGFPGSINAQTHPKATALDPGDVSSAAIYADLKARGVNPLKATAPKTLRHAYADYDFALGGGHNLENSNNPASIKSLNEAFNNLGLQSLVKARTEQPGARIKFRLVGKDAVISLPQVTNNAEDTIPIGLYYFWAERNAKATSKPETFRVIKAVVQIDIQEVTP